MNSKENSKLNLIKENMLLRKEIEAGHQAMIQISELVDSILCVLTIQSGEKTDNGYKMSIDAPVIKSILNEYKVVSHKNAVTNKFEVEVTKREPK